MGIPNSHLLTTRPCLLKGTTKELVDSLQAPTETRMTRRSNVNAYRSELTGGPHLMASINVGILSPNTLNVTYPSWAVGPIIPKELRLPLRPLPLTIHLAINVRIHRLLLHLSSRLTTNTPGIRSLHPPVHHTINESEINTPNQ